MALKIWVPMHDGKISNIGESDQTFTKGSNVSVSTAGGPFGGFVSITASGGSTNQIQFTSHNEELVTDCIRGGEFSVSVWARSTSTYNQMCVAAITYGVRLYYGNGTVSFNVFNASKNVSAIFTGSSLCDGKWHNIIGTYNDREMKARIYVDGYWKKTSASFGTAYTNTYNNNSLYIGRDPNNSSSQAYWFKGDICDVRVYNHCLSMLEISEISRGLRLHYRLNSNKVPFVNIASNPYPTFNTSAAAGGWNHWKSNSDNVTYSAGQTTDKNYIYNKSNTYAHYVSVSATSSSYYLLMYRGVGNDADVLCCMHAIMKEEYGRQITRTMCRPAVNGYKANPFGTSNGYWYSMDGLGDGFYYGKFYYMRDSDTSEAHGIQIKPGYKIYFSEVWIEQDVVIGSNFMGGGEGIIEDSSGYGYDGTIDGESVIPSLETKRFLMCTKIGNDSRIVSPVMDFTGIASGYTIAFWCKTTTTKMQMVFGFMDGNRFNAPFNGLYMNTGDSSSNPFRKPGTTTTITALASNVWHHIAITGDGTEVKIYNDGVLYGVAKTYKYITGTQFTINGWDLEGSYASNPYVCDFRIYATCLSDTQVYNLCKKGASVDYSGAVFSHEFVEQPNNIYNQLID